MADQYQGNGTWGPQTGLAGFLNPFSRDIGATELIPAAQQIFQNAGYNQQQTGASIGAGVTPRALGGTGLVAPAGTTSAYAGSNPSSSNNNNNNGGNGGGSNGGAVLGSNDQQNQQQGPSQYEQYLNNLYSSLGSAYDKMSGELNPMYDRRKQGIEDIYNSGVQNIDLQQQQGLDTLGTQRQGVETNQVRSLKDLSNAITQSYGQFSNQLGNMGAGDSSAARVMLPYALSRTEAQQRGQLNRTTADKMGEINARESALKNSVLQEKNKLDQAKMGEMGALGEWFDNAKMQISQMRLGDAKAAGEQVMSQALNRLNQIQSNYDNKASALQSWAVSNSSNLAQLKSNMSAMTDPALLGSMPSYDLSGLGQGTGVTTQASQAPTGFGYGNTEDIFKKLGVL